MIDKQAKMLTRYGEIPNISDFSEGLCHISTNEKVGYIDKEGHAILVPKVK